VIFILTPAWFIIGDDERTEDRHSGIKPGEFAAIFGKSQTWGYRQLYSGNVKAMTGYGRIMIPASEVERVLSEAGRYLGNGKVEEKQQAKITPKAKRTKAAERTNPWRSAINYRKQHSERKIIEDQNFVWMRNAPARCEN